MKKFFMLLAALMFTGAMFAQNATCYPLPEGFPTSQNLDRDYWYGHTNSESYFVLNESDMFALRIPAGTIAAGTSIEKVRFYHSTSYPNSPEVQNTIYTIKIYSGNNGDTLPGTLAYTQVYTATADGVQEVALTTPYNVGTDEIWVAVEMTDNIGAVLLCGTPEGVEENTEYPMFYSGSWGFYRFGAQGSEEYFVKPFYLTLYINDGTGYTESSDFYGEFYDYELEDQEEIETIYKYEFDDSLRVRYGIWNRGIDTARAELYLTVSIVGNGIQPILIHDNEAFGLTETPLEAGRGYIMRETLIGYDEMDAAGLVFPFEVCVDLTYDGVDPDLTNNHYCVTVDLPDGINDYSISNMNVYPNPANNVIFVNNAEGAQVTVFDINGRVVAEVEAATATQSIDVANLTQGLYIVRIANGTEVATRKISIVR
jgi:hypothetical protein